MTQHQDIEKDSREYSLSETDPLRERDPERGKVHPPVPSEYDWLCAENDDTECSDCANAGELHVSDCPPTNTHSGSQCAVIGTSVAALAVNNGGGVGTRWYAQEARVEGERVDDWDGAVGLDASVENEGTELDVGYGAGGSRLKESPA
ncbi:hypothetical protein CERSUDRAFT_124308 [Gelatoporia subvermispora B]|uniref:Uncharacterized protein n=1 Tax=Ceriporiopsis subvermispora (strain B) TaxID=914234 RepID=M2PJV7_CERS8|nr:hypothetical protein CERSUDRAFT_124308 [Gelatoporia subvermispora B]